MNQQERELYFSRIQRLQAIRKEMFQVNKSENAEDTFKETSETMLIRKANTALLRDKLFSKCEDIYSCCPQEILDLKEMAKLIAKGTPNQDFALSRVIHESLLQYYRRKKDLPSTIEMLYRLAMDYYMIGFSMEPMVNKEDNDYMYKAFLLFSEAGSYINYLDSFESDETRDFIIRSYNNIQHTIDNVDRKLTIAHHVIEFLNDETFRKKYPGIPYETLLAKINLNMLDYYDWYGKTVLSSNDMLMIMEGCDYIYEHQDPVQKATNLHEWWIHQKLRHIYGKISEHQLLDQLEMKIDRALSETDMYNRRYAAISLYIHYQNILGQNSNELKKRKTSIIRFSKQLLKFISTTEPSVEDSGLYDQMKDVIFDYHEFDGCARYEDIIRAIMSRHVPEIYINGLVTADITYQLTELVLKDAPAFFDDIEEVAQMATLEEKRAYLMDYISSACLFMDIGLVQLGMKSYERKRDYMQIEVEMLHHHPFIGYKSLLQRNSTARYADCTLGHHAYYDGSSAGYPKEYVRIRSPYRMMTDIITITSFITKHFYDYGTPFDQIVEMIQKGAGKAYSPLLVPYFDSKQNTELLKQTMETSYHNEVIRMIRKYRKVNSSTK